MATATPYQAPAPAPTQPKDPFAASGGGVWTGQGWIPKSHPGAARYTSAQPATPVDPAAPAGPPPPPTAQQLAGQARQSISGLINQPLGVNQQDPAFRTQRDAINLEAQRLKEQRQSQAAERLAAQGLNTSGAMDTAATQATQAEGGMRLSGLSDLMGREMEAQRAQLMQALQLAQQAGLTDQEMALREKLGQLDAAIRREGYGSQERIASQDAKLREMLGIGNLNLGFMQSMLGNQQFNDRLGFDIGSTQAMFDRQSLLDLL